MRAFVRQLGPAVLGVLVFTVLCGLIYPLVVTGVAQVAFHDKANGSLVTVDGTVVGSRLIGQQFADAKYFHPRPSAAGANGYDATASGASNLGPSNPQLQSTVADRVKAYRTENNMAADAPVPVDAVTASGSGLDPAISVANADDQAARVASARGIRTVDPLLVLIKAHTQGRPLGILGEPTVNVLELNLALDNTTYH